MLWRILKWTGIIVVIGIIGLLVAGSMMYDRTYEALSRTSMLQQTVR